MGTRVLFLGAGHAHLYALKRTALLAARGLEVTLVAPNDFWYSGLATGMLGGRYPQELDRVDAGDLVSRGGGRFVRDRAVRLDPANRTVHLESGIALSYDLLSLNLGSQVRRGAVPGLEEHGLPVKPIRNLLTLRERLDAAGNRTLRVVIAGGGPAGCEVAANLHARARHLGVPVDLTVLTRGERILSTMPEGAADAAWRHLRERSIRIATRSRVTRVEAGSVFTDTGDRVGFDLLVNATGLVPPPLIGESGLPVDRDGALQVDAHLRSTADPRVFGGGECIAFQDATLPKIGVYAIRQAPILFENLAAAAEDRLLRTFLPQKRYLLILNLGDGVGLAVHGKSWWYGRLAFRLKDWLDRRFLRKYQGS